MKKRVWTSAPWIIILSLLLISMAVAVYHNNQLVAYIGGGLGVLSLILGIVINVLFKRYITRIVGSALAKVASLDLDYLDRFKLPVVLTGKKGDIVWSNSRFKKQLCFYDSILVETVLFQPLFNKKIGGFKAIHCQRNLYGSCFSQFQSYFTVLTERKLMIWETRIINKPISSFF